jgi:hypothetical protein
MTQVALQRTIESCKLDETVTLYRPTAVVLIVNTLSGYDFGVL